MDVRLREQWDSLRSSYWFVPTVMTVGAVIGWAAIDAVDQFLRTTTALPVPWLYYDSLDAARTLLLAVAGAMVGIIGVVFSITTVPLTIAASQFGPRLLRTFLRDTGTQIVLGTFIATFMFCMLVLLRLHDEAQALPQLSITIGLILALLSLGALIYYINHVAVSMQAPTVAAAVSAELQTAIARNFPEASDSAPPAARMAASATLPTDFAAQARPILATQSGYVQARDDAALLQLATQHDLIIQLLRQPGQFVTENTPLAQVWPPNPIPADVGASLQAAFVLGEQRTLVQDIEFGINELVEMALRALSPAINDPFTAMTCLDWLGRALCQLCRRPFPAPVQYDAAGRLRLLIEPLTFDHIVGAAFNQIREYGRTSTAVTLHLLETIAVVGGCARTDKQRAVLLQHAVLVEAGSRDGIAEVTGRQAVATRFRGVAAQLAPRSERDGVKLLNDTGAPPSSEAVR
jgi:uncharacterized membrane protein